MAHSDLEERMVELSEELRITKGELEEKRSLNEKLELDLLQLEAYKPLANGTRSPSGADRSKDSFGIADLDLGGTKSARVSLWANSLTSISKRVHTCRTCRRGRLQYPLHHRQIRRFFRSLPASEIDSANEMPNLRKYVSLLPRSPSRETLPYMFST